MCRHLVNNLRGFPCFTTRSHVFKNKGTAFVFSPSDRSKPHPVDKLIVTCGSPANPILGARGELYKALEDMGHHFFPSDRR
jgi:predicted flavoprotein YhiN